MTSQPVHDQTDRKPTWMVQGVFDPDQTGQDFSYTIGLHDLGLPELHLWASPTDGLDPGDGWALSHNDRAHILNEVAYRMIDGRASIGSTWVERYDHGHVSVAFTVQPPGDRHALEALGIAPDAQVLPITWSLNRKPPGQLGSMSPAAENAALVEYADLVRRGQSRLGKGLSRRLPARPSFSPDQHFGPRSPLVLARAAQLDGAELVSLLSSLIPYAEGHRLAWPVTVARAVAREVGRESALQHVEEWTAEVVDRAVAELGDDWGRAVEAAYSWPFPSSAAERQRLRDNFRHLLTDVLRGVLAVEVVGDVADAGLLLMGRGPWVAGLHPQRTVPGPEWTASAGIIRTIRKTLRPLTSQHWHQIVAAHDEARREADGNSPYNTLSWHLLLLVQTSACGCPWSKLADLPAGREVRRRLGRGQAWEPMVEWASMLAALITHRAAFDADDVSTFVDPVRALLPDLDRVVNKIR